MKIGVKGLTVYSAGFRSEEQRRFRVWEGGGARTQDRDRSDQGLSGQGVHALGTFTDLIESHVQMELKKLLPAGWLLFKA